MLPAPRMFSRATGRRLGACSHPTRRLVEAAAALGDGAALGVAAALAGVDEPLAALEEACSADLLHVAATAPIGDLAFAHPLVRAAVYGQLAPTERLRLHRRGGPAGRRRAGGAPPPGGGQPASRRRAGDRAAALRGPRAPSGRMGGGGLGAAGVRSAQRAPGPARASDAARGRSPERRRCRRRDGRAGPGDATSGPFHDVTAGYLALLQGRAAEAHVRCMTRGSSATRRRSGGRRASSRSGWRCTVWGGCRAARWWTWARRAVELAGPDDPVRAEALALLGLGTAWGHRLPDRRLPMAADDALVAAAGAALASDRRRPRCACAAACAAHESLQSGSVWIAVWSYVWLARVEFALGAWDEAGAAAERAVSLLEESGHEWLRPLARCMAVSVPAARGEWAAAEEHAAAASARSGDYALMVVAAGLAGATVATAGGDHEGVLRASGAGGGVVRAGGGG